MKFTLEIELGNAAMRTYADITAELSRLNSRITEGSALMNAMEPKLTHGGQIRDINGNIVGKWEIINTQPEKENMQ